MAFDLNLGCGSLSYHTPLLSSQSAETLPGVGSCMGGGGGRGGDGQEVPSHGQPDAS